MLCTLGSNIDEQDRDGKTALMYAAAHGYTGIVVNLVKYGANKDVVDKHGLTALEYANKNGKFEIVKMIKSGTLQDVTDILQQMEIMKQKNKALQKNVFQLTEMNNELSERINATELAKNQIQKKLQDTMSKMRTQFSKVSLNTNESSISPKQMNFPKMTMNINLKQKMSEFSTGIGQMGDKFNAILTHTVNANSPTTQNSPHTQHNNSNTIKKQAPRPPSKDIKL